MTEIAITSFVFLPDEKEQEDIEITGTSPEMMQSLSNKSKVYLKKDITLRVQIAHKVDHKVFQKKVESGKLPRVPASTQEPAMKR